jgi:hypothetical protein
MAWIAASLALLAVTNHLMRGRAMMDRAVKNRAAKNRAAKNRAVTDRAMKGSDLPILAITDVAGPL